MNPQCHTTLTPCSNIIPFKFESKQLRTVVHNSEPWFVAADVCAILKINNTSQAITRLDNDEKKTLILNEGRAGNGAQSINIISESGLYALVLRSRKPEAKPFRKWVTSEVLPAIRKTGQYQHRPQAVYYPSPDEIPPNRTYDDGITLCRDLKEMALKTGDQELLNTVAHMEAVLVRAWTIMSESNLRLYFAKELFNTWSTPGKKPVGRSAPLKNNPRKPHLGRIP